MRILFFIAAFLILNSAFSQNACNCDESKIAFSQNYIASHDLIFRGKTTAVEKGQDYTMAHFTVTQLFKGSSPKEITLYYSNKNECGLKIAAGEDWLFTPTLSKCKSLLPN